MRRNIFLVVIFILSTVHSHVTERVKNAELSDTVVVRNESDNVVATESKQPATKAKENNESKVYLDDVLFTLKNQKWAVEEEQCLDHIYRLLYSLQNFTLWAVWDWDSQSSEPQGLLFANQYQLGNFDQCMRAPWWRTHRELRTKYCLASIKLERTDKSIRRRIDNPGYPYQSALDFIERRPPHSRPLNELVWGACVPATCGPHTVERLLGVMLARSHLGTAGMRPNITVTEPCQVRGEQRKYDGLFFAFIGVVASLALICLVCTYLNFWKKLTPDTPRTKVIQAFCLKENARDLLKMKKEGVEVFYGIRFLTICLIVVDHQIGISNSGPISDGLRSDEETQSLVGLLILHDDLFVDTFFLLSGFLTITTLSRSKRLPNPLLIILKRYIRLVVALAMVVFYISAVFPHTGSGPLWNRAVAQETGPCRENWWLNLLMLSNYLRTENMCLVASWYIPCDFHFFVITILVYYLFKTSRRLGLVLAAILTTSSIVVPGIINYVYQLSAVQLFTFDFVVNPLGSKEFHLTYITSHTRYAAYLVGFYTGHIFVRLSANGNLKRIKQRWSILGVCSALILMLAVMVVGSTFLWRTYDPLEGAVYAALNRPAWAAGVALIVICCSLGSVPLVTSFLSWYPWVPLSRLAYGLYLTHTVLITRNVFITRNPQHNDYFEILNAAIGVIFWGCLGAVLLWLLAEGPATKLLALCLRARIEKIGQESGEPTNISADVDTNTQWVDPSSNCGRLHENLPTIIHYTSKI